MSELRETLMNAEIAYANKQYNEAYRWYKEVLRHSPDDLYALSKVGSISVPLGNYDEALTCFRRIMQLDPGVGDHVFNYANACLFTKNTTEAFAAYVKAEKMGCSEDVLPRLYYQLALICSAREDRKSALLYLKKCEDNDREGNIVLTPDLISEKLKLYMLEEDYTNAEQCAAQLVAIQPALLKNYMVYYSILMAHKKYDEAKSVLTNAQKYAVNTASDRYNVVLQMAAVGIAESAEHPDEKLAYCHASLRLLYDLLADQDITQEQYAQVVISIAEAYTKADELPEAIQCLKLLLAESTETVKPVHRVQPLQDLTEYEAEQMIQADIALVQQKIYAGELDPNLGSYVQPCYDAYGNEFRYYDPEVFACLNTSENDDQSDTAVPQNKLEGFVLPVTMSEKVYFGLLTAYLALDNFVDAEKYARALKHSNNTYYAYFGLYTATMIARKISGLNTKTRKQYDEALAFFRSKAFANPGDTLATVFRARLYAEDGKCRKAEEMAMLLPEKDRQSVLDYIESCRP